MCTVVTISAGIYFENIGSITGNVFIYPAVIVKVASGVTFEVLIPRESGDSVAFGSVTHFYRCALISRRAVAAHIEVVLGVAGKTGHAAFVGGNGAAPIGWGLTRGNIGNLPRGAFHIVPGEICHLVTYISNLYIRGSWARDRSARRVGEGGLGEK